MTVIRLVESNRSALEWGTAELGRSGIEHPRLTAELLLAWSLEIERVRVLTRIDDQLQEGAVQRFRALLQRRAAGEPLEYITGQREFYGHRFEVSPAVLIPRPETEHLVERAIEFARSARKTGSVDFLDVGTGSGCIAVGFALEVPRARGVALDLSADAIAVARRNAVRLGVAKRIAFMVGDLLEAVAPRPAFDLILANPPYVARAEAGALPRTVIDWEPHSALFGGDSGLDAIALLAPLASARLRPGGCFLLEIGSGQSRAVRKLLEGAALEVREVIPDLQGIERCLVAHKVS